MTPGFFYVATPYRGYLEPAGFEYAHNEARLDLAYNVAKRFGARLIDRGVEVFVPVVHWHEMSKLTRADPNNDFWLERCLPFMVAARGIIVGKIPGWDISKGIAFERKFFADAAKPSYLIEELFSELPGSLR